MRIINLFLAVAFLVAVEPGVVWRNDGMIEWSDYCTIVGTEIARFTSIVKASEACGNLCLINPDCRYFEASDKEGVCVLKKDLPSTPGKAYSEVLDSQKRCGSIIKRFVPEAQPIVEQSTDKPTAPSTVAPTVASTNSSNGKRNFNSM